MSLTPPNFHCPPPSPQPWQHSPASLPPLPYSVASIDDALASLDGALPVGEEGAQQSSRVPWAHELSSSESDSEHGLEPWKVTACLLGAYSLGL